MTMGKHRLGMTAAVLVLAVSLGGCGSFRTHQGFVFDQVLSDSVAPGVDNKDSVARTLGRPSFEGQFDDNSWYYLSRETRQFAYRVPRPVQQTLLAVRFDKDGNVTRVERAGLDNVRRISPVSDKTPTLGRKDSILNELFGNIGRIGASGQGVSSTDNPGSR
jgi:outer membrane protein assembly factor BamE (lipoprotein component of BamABCDE complex)